MSLAEAEETARELSPFEPDTLFLVWGPPSHGPRSRVFARELGIDVRFIRSIRRRGLLTAPLRYASMAIKTLRVLLVRRPRLILVQSPPSVAVIVVALWCAVSGSRFVVDAHSAAMLSPYWTKPAWLSRALARRAAATIVTNEHFARSIRAKGGRALVIPDIPTSFRRGDPPALGIGFHVMVVNSFADDEPLAEIVAAARELEGVVFYVTGDPGRTGAFVPESLPKNVRLTGFLPDPAYYALMSACHAVLCLTTRDHTMQRGACEALWIGTPIVTSDWPMLREYFSAGTVHVHATASAIRDGVHAMVVDHARHAEEIGWLAEQRRAGWHDAIAALRSLEGATRRRHTRALDERKDR